MRRLFLQILVFSFVLSACDNGENSVTDAELRRNLITQGFVSATTKPATNSIKVELGQKLFFDKILSGNKDISCATCHHPLLNTGDRLPISIGTGGSGLGSERQIGNNRSFIPRNAPELYNRGHATWRSMFWDGRVSGSALEGFKTPALTELPFDLDSLLAAQALFPITSRDEMRGKAGDVDRFGIPNEIAQYPDNSFTAIWNAVLTRVKFIPEYQQLLIAAYPNLTIDQIGIAQIANAIAAFESERFDMLRSPFDDYANGNNNAISENAKKGALLFFGKAKCGLCHSGILFTDQIFHNIGVPQLGPGKGSSAPLDFGRFLQTGNINEKFAFRTPSLRNVTLTGPYMHNGAYQKLRDAVIHHLNPTFSLANYNVAQLRADLQSTVRNDAATQQQIYATLDQILIQPTNLSNSEIDQLMEFLDALTDPAAIDLSKDVPAKVPSGLPLYN